MPPLISAPALQKPPAGALIDWSHPLGSQIVGAWFDLEAQGNLSFDLSGRNHGILTGGLIRIPSSRFGSVWDVSSGKYASVPLSWVGRAEPLTVSVWFRVNNVATATQGIFSWAGAANSGTPFLMIQNNSGNLRIFWGNGYQEASQTLVSGAWYNVVFTWDGASREHYYLNGRLLRTAVLAAANQATATSVFMGNGFSASFVGHLGPVVIWKAALGQGSVAQLYQQPFAPLLVPAYRRLLPALSAPAAGRLPPGRRYLQAVNRSAVV